MRLIAKILIIFLLLVRANSSTGQDISVKAAFDTSKIWLGDQINYSFSVEQPADLSLYIPVLKDTLCKSIEIVSGPVIDTSFLENNRLKIIGTYLVTSFDSGFYEAPPLYAEFKDSSGIRRFFSDYSYLEVMRVRIAPADTTQKIFDIIDPYRAPITLSEVAPWILLAAAVVFLILIIWRYARRWLSPRPEKEVEIPAEAPHIIAFRELEALKAEELWQKNQVKQYYSRLTEILRTYLENRYEVNSLELTTRETLDELRRKGFGKNDLFESLGKILTGSDMVKFAKYIPEKADHERYFDESWTFIEKTMEVMVDDDATTGENEKEAKP